MSCRRDMSRHIVSWHISHDICRVEIWRHFVNVTTCHMTFCQYLTDTSSQCGFRASKQHVFHQHYQLSVYEANSILVRPAKSWSDESFVAAHKEMYEELEAKGFNPTLNVTDNEYSKAVQNYINSQNVSWQLVEPNNHWVNTSKRSIQTFKNHFISGLCSVNACFPLQLLCYLLDQAKVTLNLLQTSCADPKESAYEDLNGKFDYNKTPLAPPWTEALIFEATARRAAWGPHAVDGWYLEPAMKHYRKNATSLNPPTASVSRAMQSSCPPTSEC